MWGDLLTSRHREFVLCWEGKFEPMDVLKTIVGAAGWLLPALFGLYEALLGREVNARIKRVGTMVDNMTAGRPISFGAMEEGEMAKREALLSVDQRVLVHIKRAVEALSAVIHTRVCKGGAGDTVLEADIVSFAADLAELDAGPAGGKGKAISPVLSRILQRVGKGLQAYRLAHHEHSRLAVVYDATSASELDKLRFVYAECDVRSAALSIEARIDLLASFLMGIGHVRRELDVYRLMRHLTARGDAADSDELEGRHEPASSTLTSSRAGVVLRGLDAVVAVLEFLVPGVTDVDSSNLGADGSLCRIPSVCAALDHVLYALCAYHPEWCIHRGCTPLHGVIARLTAVPYRISGSARRYRLRSLRLLLLHGGALASFVPFSSIREVEKELCRTVFPASRVLDWVQKFTPDVVLSLKEGNDQTRGEAFATFASSALCARMVECADIRTQGGWAESSRASNLVFNAVSAGLAAVHSSMRAAALIALACMIASRCVDTSPSRGSGRGRMSGSRPGGDSDQLADGSMGKGGGLATCSERGELLLSECDISSIPTAALSRLLDAIVVLVSPADVEVARCAITCLRATLARRPDVMFSDLTKVLCHLGAGLNGTQPQLRSHVTAFLRRLVKTSRKYVRTEDGDDAGACGVDLLAQSLVEIGSLALSSGRGHDVQMQDGRVDGMQESGRRALLLVVNNLVKGARRHIESKHRPRATNRMTSTSPLNSEATGGMRRGRDADDEEDDSTVFTGKDGSLVVRDQERTLLAVENVPGHVRRAMKSARESGKRGGDVAVLRRYALKMKHEKDCERLGLDSKIISREDLQRMMSGREVDEDADSSDEESDDGADVSASGRCRAGTGKSGRPTFSGEGSSKSKGRRVKNVVAMKKLGRVQSKLRQLEGEQRGDGFASTRAGGDVVRTGDHLPHALWKLSGGASSMRNRRRFKAQVKEMYEKSRRSRGLARAGSRAHKVRKEARVGRPVRVATHVKP